jgi:hypothetical protein
MTIAAGFVCRDGILLCTDSQYTAAEKTQKDKLFMRPFNRASISFAFVGDEDYGKTAIEEGMLALKELPENHQSVWDIRRCLRRSISRVLDEFSQRKHLDQSQKPEFLISISTQQSSPKLFLCRESAFAQVADCDFRGSGTYLAGYIAATIGLLVGLCQLMMSCLSL